MELTVEDRRADQPERSVDGGIGDVRPSCRVFLSKQTNAAVGMPYECVVSEVGLIGLTEPSLPTVAATPSGSLAYQVREYLQAFIVRDRHSYRLSVSRRAPETLTRGREAGVDGCTDAPERSLVSRSGPAINCEIDESCPSGRGTRRD